MGLRMTGFGYATRFALGFVQSLMGLFAAGTVVYEAHRLFLWYYAREYVGIQISGVNDCAGEDWVANGDLFEGKTFCNKPENFAPWYLIYEHHWLAALVYYGAIAAVLFLIGWLWLRHQRKSAPVDPTGQQPHGNSADDNTI